MIIGTYVRVDVCRDDKSVDQLKIALGDVWDRFSYIEEHMNAYDSASDIGRINSAEGNFVKDIPSDVYELIKKSVQYAQQTYDKNRPGVNLAPERQQENSGRK